MILPLFAIGQKHGEESLNTKEEFIEYYPNGQIQLKGTKINQIIVDTLYTYCKNGDSQTIQIFHGMTYPRKVYYYENLKRMAAKKREGFFIQTNNTTYIKEGTWKYYYKNGQVMDSVLFKNGEQIYRARFNKKGELQFEQ